MYKNVVELFAGVGGFRCGLNNVELLNNEEVVENGDWNFVWANQWEPSTKTQDAFNCYVKRFGESPNHVNEDISLIDKKTIPEHNLLVGGFPCLTGDTLIFTMNGFKKIIDITVEDRVLSHDGKYHKVTALLEQGIKPIYKISGLVFDNLSITGNHLLYVRKNDNGVLGLPEWKTVEELFAKDNDGEYLYKKYLLCNIVNGNSRTPRYKGVEFSNSNFWYILGKIIGNGFKTEDLSELTTVYNGETIKEFLNNFRENGKVIFPSSLFDLSPLLLKKFLEGYSDSKLAKKDGETTIFKHKRANIIYGLAQCVSKVYKIPVSVKQTEKGYYLIFKSNLSQYKDCYYLNRQIWYPFINIEKTNQEEMVYDLTIEDSHSFVANNCVVHNCQDYSVARSLSNEKGIEGKKGVLFWQIAEILEEKRPAFVLLENVDRLLISPSKQRGRDFAIMLRTFYDLGYSVQWQVINAADYGMPQKRKRIFIFAYRMETKYYSNIKNFLLEDIILKEGLFGKVFPVKKTEESYHLDIFNYKDILDVSDNHKTGFLNSGCMMNGVVYSLKTESIPETIFPLKDIIVQQPVAQTSFLSENEIERFSYLKGSKRIPRTKPNGEPYMYTEGKMAFPDNLDVPARTMLTSERTVNRSSHVVRDVCSGELRYLTPVEAERINCFPDNWTNTGMSEKRRFFMMGNALVVGIIKRLEPEISNIINNED